MRSLITVGVLVLFTPGCDSAEQSKGAPKPTAASPKQDGIAAPAVPSSTASSVDVCRHIREVAAKDQPETSLLDEVERDCLVALERVRKQYDTLTSCLLNTSLAGDVVACEHSMRSWTDLLSKADPKPTSAEVCSHVMDVMKREFGDAAGAPKPSDEELAKAIERCIDDLEREREKIGAEKYDAQAECIMAATTMDAMAECEKNE